MSLSAKLAQFQKRRTFSGPLPSGSAPYTSSKSFKNHDLEFKPEAKTWNHRLSRGTFNQKPSPLKYASRKNNQSNLISLGTARPSPEFYPWAALTMHPDKSATTRGANQAFASLIHCTKGEAGYDLSIALNYGYSAGSPQVLRFITEHVELIHNPPYEDWGSCLTCGTTSALEIAFRIFCNPGDTVIVEKYSYTGTLATIQAQGLQTLGVEMDNQGLIPEDLDYRLVHWDEARGPKPFLLYTIPTGQNPTGTTQSKERRRMIYEVAVKHDLYILEDDPYYFLQLATTALEKSLDDFVNQLPPSYLSLDVHGRVLRMDTTSKILAPGLRCGWVTGSSQIIDAFTAYSEVGVLSLSGPSQIMVYKLLDETWGHEGFIKWLASLSFKYQQRLDVMIRACEQHLPGDVCQWQIPDAGMFVWVCLDLTKHPFYKHATSTTERQNFVLDVEDRVYNKCQQANVLISKGSWFSESPRETQSVFMRLTFAAANIELLADAIARLAKPIRIEFSSMSDFDTKILTSPELQRSGSAS